MDWLTKLRLLTADGAAASDVEYEDYGLATTPDRELVALDPRRWEDGAQPPALACHGDCWAVLDAKLVARCRARSHRRLVLPLVRFILDPLTCSVPLFLKRQCDRTLGAEPQRAGFLRRVPRARLAPGG